MYFIEYYIKDQKHFWQQWEKMYNHLPKDCHFIQCFSSKNLELCISIWDCKNLKVLEVLTKEYFEGYAKWKCHEMDTYHMEGEAFRRLA